MPTSSTSRRPSQPSASQPVIVVAAAKPSAASRPRSPPRSRAKVASVSARRMGRKLNRIQHISSPSSLASTASAMRGSLAAARPAAPADQAATVSLAGQLVATGPLSSLERRQQQQQPGQRQQQLSAAGAQGSPRPALAGAQKAHQSAYLAASSQYLQLERSQASLAEAAAPPSQASSCAHLVGGLSQHQHPRQHQHPHPHQHQQQPARLSIRRHVNLKCIKSVIIMLMALDLFTTVFVYHFASADQVPIWFSSSSSSAGQKVRLSLVNLLLSSVWFVLLVGAILFDVYLILLISTLVHAASFLLLLCLSFIHFSRRIDYSSVQLTSLLLLLFGVVLLHVYLLAMGALTAYLTMAVRRRRKSSSA